jgi:hypothetical protein
MLNEEEQELIEKTEWFNKLPYQKLGDQYVRKFCPCGWIIDLHDNTEKVALNSWIDTHFPHRLQGENVSLTHDELDEIADRIASVKRNHSQLYRYYDFSREIKFTRAGISLFINDFGIWTLEEMEPYAICRDPAGNKFCFKFNRDVKDDYAQIFATIVPERTEVR